MTAEPIRTDPDAGPAAQAVGLVVLVKGLTRRADFLRAAQARRQGGPAFLLQARNRGDGDPAARIGFTCSRKVGNAVTRNRAKRRLRALARAVLPEAARPGWDYVLVGRPEATVDRGFALMLEDLRRALGLVHGGPASAAPQGQGKGRRGEGGRGEGGRGKGGPGEGDAPRAAEPVSGQDPRDPAPR